MANKRRNVDQERRWRERIKRQAGSGLTVRAFCRREKLSEPSFHAWRRTLRQRDAAAELPQRIKLSKGVRNPFELVPDTCSAPISWIS